MAKKSTSVAPAKAVVKKAKTKPKAKPKAKTTTPKTKRKYTRRVVLDNTSIGKLGEHISSMFLLRDGLFDIENLGGVVPAFDLLCTIKDKAKPYMFIVQVKAMAVGEFTKRGDICIKTPVPTKKLKWLADRPLPSYVMGVDVKLSEAYIAPAFDRNKLYANIPIKYKMTMNDEPALKSLLQDIKDEVIRYWDGNNISTYKQSFKSVLV